MALTATATPRVRQDIISLLGVHNAQIFIQSFNRTNLRYFVKKMKASEAFEDMVKLIKSQFRDCSGIIYCFSQKDCENLADKLAKHSISAAPYHAGLDNTTRHATQSSWTDDRIQVICATIAFGMGIDKPDVRFVFHYTIPKSTEGYYQESGRAGRDGLPSTCILYDNISGRNRVRKMILNSENNTFGHSKVALDQFDSIVRYCDNEIDCRRTQLLSYFDEEFNPALCKQHCDNCASGYLPDNRDVTREARQVLSLVHTLYSTKASFKKHWSRTHYISILRGSKSKSLRNHNHHKLDNWGSCASMKAADVDRLITKLCTMGFLKSILYSPGPRQFPFIALVPGNTRKLQGFLARPNAQKITLLFRSRKRARPTVATESETNTWSLKCLNALKAERKAIADQLQTENADVRVWHVLDNKILSNLAFHMPTTRAEFYQVPGAYESMDAQVVDRLLAIIRPIKESRDRVSNGPTPSLTKTPSFGSMNIAPPNSITDPDFHSAPPPIKRRRTKYRFH